MKKLLTVVLILAMLMPAAAPAEERDPIVGCWYMYIDGDLYPDLAASFGGCDTYLQFYYFLEDGTIKGYDNTSSGGTMTQNYVLYGTWQKADNGYSINIPTVGTGYVYIDRDLIIFPLIYVQDTYQVMRRAIPFDPNSDIVRQ